MSMHTPVTSLARKGEFDAHATRQNLAAESQIVRSSSNIDIDMLSDASSDLSDALSDSELTVPDCFRSADMEDNDEEEEEPVRNMSKQALLRRAARAEMDRLRQKAEDSDASSTESAETVRDNVSGASADAVGEPFDARAYFAAIRERFPKAYEAQLPLFENELEQISSQSSSTLEDSDDNTSSTIKSGNLGEEDDDMDADDETDFSDDSSEDNESNFSDD